MGAGCTPGSRSNDATAPGTPHRLGPQGSNILTSLSKANGLAICPADLPRKNAGQAVKIIMLDWNEEVNA